MRKAILVILAMAILLVSNAVFSAEDLTEVMNKNLRSNPPEFMYVYSGESVAASDNETFYVPLVYSNGYVSFMRVAVGASTEADVFVSGFDNATADDPYTFVSGINISGSYTWPIEEPLPYFNTEAEVANRLTLTLVNDDASNATGEWYVIIIVEGK